MTILCIPVICPVGWSCCYLLDKNISLSVLSLSGINAFALLRWMLISPPASGQASNPWHLFLHSLWQQGSLSWTRGRSLSLRKTLESWRRAPWCPSWGKPALSSNKTGQALTAAVSSLFPWPAPEPCINWGPRWPWLISAFCAAPALRVVMQVGGD